MSSSSDARYIIPVVENSTRFSVSLRSQRWSRVTSAVVTKVDDGRPPAHIRRSDIYDEDSQLVKVNFVVQYAAAESNFNTHTPNWLIVSLRGDANPSVEYHPRDRVIHLEPSFQARRMVMEREFQNRRDVSSLPPHVHFPFSRPELPALPPMTPEHSKQCKETADMSEFVER